MDIVFNEEELKLIDDRREQVSPPGGYIPEDRKDKIITIGLKISDVYKFDLFMEKFLADNNIKDQIGAECVHVDLKTPIAREIISNLRNSLNMSLNDVIEGFNKANSGLNGLVSISSFMEALAEDTIQDTMEEAPTVVPDVDEEIPEEGEEG